MTKTIWYVTKYFAPETKNSVGGRGWLLMKEFASKNCQPVVITSDSNNLVDLPNFESKVTENYKEGVKIVTLKTLKYTVAKSVRRILSWIHFEWNLFWLEKKTLPKPDVIIVSSPSILTILNGFFLKKKYKCKLVLEVRDIWPLVLMEVGGFSPYNPFILFLGFIERWSYKQSDLIVGTMPNLSEHVKQVLGYSKLVDCIPMGLDQSMIKNVQSITPEYVKQYLKPKYFNIVYAGTLNASNAIDIFFKAADALKENSKIRFIIVGDGALKKIYQKKYGHLKNLIFAPKVTKNQVQSVLSYADVVYFSVYKSKVWDYGQSLNKVIDYMISKKPILASYSGYPSMINESNCGFFVPAEEVMSLVSKIKELALMSESERNTIGAKGRSWLIENRTYKKLANDYLNLLF